jgi:hypothetical protein
MKPTNVMIQVLIVLLVVSGLFFVGIKFLHFPVEMALTVTVALFVITLVTLWAIRSMDRPYKE